MYVRHYPQRAGGAYHSGKLAQFRFRTPHDRYRQQQYGTRVTVTFLRVFRSTAAITDWNRRVARVIRPGDRTPPPPPTRDRIGSVFVFAANDFANSRPSRWAYVFLGFSWKKKKNKRKKITDGHTAPKLYDPYDGTCTTVYTSMTIDPRKPRDGTCCVKSAARFLAVTSRIRDRRGWCTFSLDFREKKNQKKKKITDGHTAPKPYGLSRTRVRRDVRPYTPL